MAKDVKGYPSVYDYEVDDLSGNSIALSKYKGSVCVFVNISSKVPNAAQYLKVLYLSCGAFHGKGVKLFLFPCFQFDPVEDTNELANFVRQHCPGVGEVFQPIEVNGAKASGLYKFLKAKKTGDLGGVVNGNFTAFVANRVGEPVARFNPGFKIDELRDSINECMTRDLQFYSI